MTRAEVPVEDENRPALDNVTSTRRLSAINCLIKSPIVKSPPFISVDVMLLHGRETGRELLCFNHSPSSSINATHRRQNHHCRTSFLGTADTWPLLSISSKRTMHF